MQTKSTGFIIILVVGIAIGAVSMAILQVRQVPKIDTSNPTTTQQEAIITSAQSIAIPKDSVEGVITRIQDDLLTIQVTGDDADVTKTIQLFDDTQVTVVAQPTNSEKTPQTSFTTKDIAVHQKIQATGIFNNDGVLLANYLVVFP